MTSAPRRILITGASSGIGRALALHYAQPSASLVLFGRDAARLEAIAQECRAKGSDVETSVVDVRDRQGMKAKIEEAQNLAPLDLVIANAGVATGLSPGKFSRIPMRCAQLFR